jgi:ubiquinone/menaquinone biosynthesis C-methylase UbiE
MNNDNISTDEKTKIVVSTYNKIANIYSDKYFSDRSDFPYVDAFLSYVTTGKKVLDIGSGPGNFSKYLYDKDYEVEGIDLSEKMLEIAKSNVPNVSFTYMDMRTLSFQRESFDGLIAPYSLIHIPTTDIPQTLNGFMEVLKPGGVLLIITQAGEPDRIVDETLIKGLKMFINFFTRNRLKNLLSEAGFETVYQEEKRTKDLDSFSNRVIYTIAQKPR